MYREISEASRYPQVAEVGVFPQILIKHIFGSSLAVPWRYGISLTCRHPTGVETRLFRTLWYADRSGAFSVTAQKYMPLANNPKGTIRGRLSSKKNPEKLNGWQGLKHARQSVYFLPACLCSMDNNFESQGEFSFTFTSMIKAVFLYEGYCCITHHPPQHRRREINKKSGSENEPAEIKRVVPEETSQDFYFLISAA